MQLLRDTAEATENAPTIRTELAERFVALLLSIPLAEWYECATQASASDVSEASRALDAATRSPEAMFIAWLVRDHVETACHRFGSAEGRHVCPSSHARELRTATERAALALLFEGALSDEHVSRLRGGFAALDLTRSPSAPPR